MENRYATGQVISHIKCCLFTKVLEFLQYYIRKSTEVYFLWTIWCFIFFIFYSQQLMTSRLSSWKAFDKYFWDFSFHSIFSWWSGPREFAANIQYVASDIWVLSSSWEYLYKSHDIFAVPELEGWNNTWKLWIYHWGCQCSWEPWASALIQFWAVPCCTGTSAQLPNLNSQLSNQCTSAVPWLNS